MNYKQNHLMIDLINIILRFMIIYAILAILLHRIASSSVLSTLCLLPAPFISYFIRRYTSHLWSFLALHVTLTAVYAYMAGNIYIRIAYCLYLIILTIHAFYQKQKPADQENTSLYFIVIFALLYLISNYLVLPGMMHLNFSFAIVYVLLCILNIYFRNSNNFFQNHESLMNVPYHQIKSSNNILMIFLSSLFFIAMMIFSKLPFGSFLSFLGNLLIRILRAFFSLFRPSNNDNIESVQEIAAESKDTMEFLPAAETSDIMKMIEAILQWILTAAVIAALIALLLYALYQLYQFFYRKNKNSIIDKTEFISPFDKRVTIKKNPHKRFRNLFGRSNNDVIRKYFYKAVTSSVNSGKELPKDLTPSQLSEYVVFEAKKLNGPADEKKKLLTSFYEKARYSNEECSKKEIQIVKDILK